jgi:hypothetical protein
MTLPGQCVCVLDYGLRKKEVQKGVVRPKYHRDVHTKYRSLGMEISTQITPTEPDGWRVRALVILRRGRNSLRHVRTMDLPPALGGIEMTPGGLVS